MKANEVCERIIAVFAGTWLGNRWGILMPLISLFTILMVTDYISGMLAAKKEAIEHPNNKKYGWSSKKSILGIYKKVGYLLTVFMALCLDYLIYQFADKIGLRYNSDTIFGIMVTIWFIINESISIMENVGRMGVRIPPFFRKTLVELKKDMDKDGCQRKDF